MLNELKKEANKTLTENGAVTYRTTQSDCLDLFAAIGALRRESEREIIERFARAYAEDPGLAMKILFYARDVRGGLGERRVFRTCLRWLSEYAPESVRRNLVRIAEYGRWDDVLCLLDTKVEADALDLIKRQLADDMRNMKAGKSISLAAKWLPSLNTSSPNPRWVSPGATLFGPSGSSITLTSLNPKAVLTAVSARSAE